MITTEAPSTDARLMMLAAKQDGVVHRRQLPGVGISSRVLARRIRSGQCRELLPGVFAVGPAAYDTDAITLRRAAVLYLGPDAAVSHVAAARLHGIWDRADTRTHVVTTERRRPIPPNLDIVQHRSIHAVEPHVVDIGGLPVTNVARTIVECGQVMSRFEVARLIAQASFLGLFDRTSVLDLLDERWSEPGTRVARDAVEMFAEGDVGSRSGSEERLARRLIERGAPEFWLNRRTIEGLGGFEPDFAFPDGRLIVEVNGERGHAQPGMSAYDRTRAATFRNAGWRVHEVPAWDIWTDVDAVVDDILRLLERPVIVTGQAGRGTLGDNDGGRRP